MADELDLVVIGAGPGGYVAALRAAQLGLQVACIDRRATPGGTCLHVGCIPSKALLDSSELYRQAQTRLDRHGIKVGEVTLDLATMMRRKQQVVKTLTEGIGFLFKKNKVQWHQGTGRLAGVGKVLVTGAGGSEQTLQTKNILVATGSEPIALPALPFDGTALVSSTEALSFESVPRHLIVVGGGYIGLELGSVWHRLGAKVTVVEFLPRIVPVADTEIGELLHKSLVQQGLSFHLETRVVSASLQAGQVIVNATHKGEDLLLQGDRVLVSVGRRPYTTGLGLETVGVELEERTGRIPVGKDFQTRTPGIYAIGDVIAGPMLAHKAEEEGIAVAELLAGQKPHVNYDTIPSVIYTHPEVASVGLTEDQLKADGRSYRVGRFPFAASGRAHALDDIQGRVKVLSDAKTDRLLGVHIIGPHASELIAECVAVMEFSGSAEDIARICHAHPTLSEAVREAAYAAAFGRGLNA